MVFSIKILLEKKNIYYIQGVEWGKIRKSINLEIFLKIVLYFYGYLCHRVIRFIPTT